MLGDLRRLSAVLGRRTLIRYAGLGLLTAVVAGCSGEKGNGGGAAARTVEAFANGRWTLSAMGAQCVLTVGDGTFRMSDFVDPPGEAGNPLNGIVRGTYTLTAGVLQVQTFTTEDDDSPKQGVGQQIPAEVGDAATTSVQWSYGAEAPSPVPVAWDGTNLVVTFPNYNGPLVITGTRA